MKINEFISRLFLTVLLIVLFSTLAKSQIHRPQQQVPFIKSSPVIDGNLSDDVWQRASEMTEFVNWSLDSYVKDPVSVYLYYDEKNLYVGFRNNDPKAGDLNRTVSPKGPWDTFLWGRNHAMVGIGYKDNNIRLMADPKGTMTDWKNNDNWGMHMSHTLN